MKRNFSVARAIIETLEKSEVEFIFGFPGETSLPLYSEFQQCENLKHVLARCPRCAGYMADAYARISGKIGFCDAPGGIGSPFVIPAFHEARNSSSPIILISSGVPRQKRYRWTTSHCNQQELFSPVAKSTLLVENADETQELLNRAITEASMPRLGPVLLEVPSDILASEMSESLENYNHSSQYPGLRVLPDPDTMRMVEQKIRSAKNPVVFAGGGVHLSGAKDNIIKIANELKIPVATSLNGKGSIPEFHPLALGVSGSKGIISANEYLIHADCIIVLGSKLGDKSTNSYSWPHDGQAVLHIDNDPSELHSRSKGYIPVLSDIDVFCRELLVRLQNFCVPQLAIPKQVPFWEQGLTDYLCRKLTNSLPEDSVIVADASVASGWAGAAIKLHSAKQRVITPRGSGSLGFALPATIGASFAAPNARIIGIGGDGGFAMAMHEMETAARYQLPIIYFLLNNCRLNLIDKHIKRSYGGDSISKDFIDINWIAAATSFGWQALKIENAGQLDISWNKIMESKVPTLVEIRIPPEEIAPDFFITTKREM